jgi:hypothetical protein
MISCHVVLNLPIKLVAKLTQNADGIRVRLLLLTSSSKLEPNSANLTSATQLTLKVLLDLFHTASQKRPWLLVSKRDVSGLQVKCLSQITVIAVFLVLLKTQHHGCHAHLTLVSQLAHLLANGTQELLQLHQLQDLIVNHQLTCQFQNVILQL